MFVRDIYKNKLIYNIKCNKSGLLSQPSSFVIIYKRNKEKKKQIKEI